MNKRAWCVAAVGVASVAFASAAHAGWTAAPRVAGRAPAREVLAPGQAVGSHVEVLVLVASNGPGGIAPTVTSIQQLHRPPFSAFRQISEHSRTTLTLGPTPSTVALPNGSATLTSTGRGADGRFTVLVQVTHNGHTHAIHFVATPGDPFFTVSESGETSALILGFTVR